ncbi:MAG: oligosaccharide flippase family protein [Actinomycetota bacterium]
MRGSAWVLIGRVISIVFGVGINALLARLLTPTEFGAYFTTFTMVIVGAVIAQLGLDRALVKVAAAAIGVGEPGRAREAIRRCLTIGGATAVVAGLVLSFVAGPALAEHVFHSPVVDAAMPLAGGWLIATALQSLMVETFRGLQDFGRATLYDALLVDILLATTLGIIFTSGAIAIDIRGAVAITGGVTFLVLLLGARHLRREIRGVSGEGSLQHREIFDIAWPSLVTNVAIYFLGSGIDLLVLGAFRPQSDVALYGSATRLVTLVATPLWIIRGVMPPIVAELHAKGQRRQLEDTLRAGASLAGLPSLAILTVFVLFGASVMEIIYSPFYRQGSSILVILSIGRLIAVWSGAAGITLMMTGHQRSMMVVTLATGALSVTAGIMAADRYGAVGVAAATAAVAVFQNLLQVALAKRYVGVWTFVQLSPRKLRDFFLRGDIRSFLQRRRTSSVDEPPGLDD